MASFLREQGHEVWLLCFKRFESRLVPDEDKAEWARIQSATYPTVIEPREEGDVPCPYLHPATEHEWEMLVNKVAEIGPDLVGLTVPTSTYDAGREATRRIKKRLPDVPVVWGGPHATICPEECLETADMAAVGEAEHTIAELCADPGRTDIAGLWRRENGRIVKAPHRLLEQDLDRFPWASYGENEWLIEDNQAVQKTPADVDYFRTIYMIMTQRGCPFRCTYCIHHLTSAMHKGERYFRRRSVDKVLDECEARGRQFDLPGFAFFDDVFVIHPKWIAEFAEKYPKRIGLPFGGFAYPLVSKDEMFRQLKEAGMVFLGLGVQTGSDYIGKEIYGRRYDSEKIVELAWTADKYGFSLNYELLTNCPYEREEDALDTLKLLLRMPKPGDVKLKKIVFFPGLKVNEVDLPRPNLPESTFDFYTQLYLMSRHHLIPPERMLALANDEYLKANPKVLQSVAHALHLAVEQGRASQAEAARLVVEQTQVTFHGLLRYAKRLVVKWLPQPIENGLRALFGKKRPA